MAKAPTKSEMILEKLKEISDRLSAVEKKVQTVSNTSEPSETKTASKPVKLEQTHPNDSETGGAVATQFINRLNLIHENTDSGIVDGDAGETGLEPEED